MTESCDDERSAARPEAIEHGRVGEVFRSAFGCEVPAPELLVPLLGEGRDPWHYIKRVLHFDAAVVRPLERRGLSPSHSIVDLASGDGELSLALALRGFGRLTLWDLDAERLARAERIVRSVTRACRDVALEPSTVRASATELDGPFDVLVSYQTLEHLSDRGNYSVASRACQREFLRRVDRCVRHLAYFNAPNLLYPFDGHDTGKLGFHFLPIAWREALIRRGLVRCSWAGVAQPVSVGFVTRHLPAFRLVSGYHAFDDALDYLANRPPFDYMGAAVPALDLAALSAKRRAIVRASRLLGKGAQNFLPVLSLVLARRDRASDEAQGGGRAIDQAQGGGRAIDQAQGSGGAGGAGTA